MKDAYIDDNRIITSSEIINNSNKYKLLYDSCNKLIFTTRGETMQIALNEMKSRVPSSRLIEWIGEGVGIVGFDENFNIVCSEFRKVPPVFIRHICPVNFKLDIKNEIEDIEMILEKLSIFINNLDNNRTFSVQTRFIGEKEKPYKKFAVNQRLADKIMEYGVPLDVSLPQQIISVVCTDTKAYLGISMSEDNISDWAGGKQRFIREDGMISRAEFKLLEAINVFKISMPENGIALDLGAAPGGWTRVLREFNLRVVAVDPANIHYCLFSDTGVVHLKQTAQKFFETNQQHFDIIVNDMKMDVKESIEIMSLAEPYLKQEGIGIITLKLPRSNWQRITNKAIDFLKKHYSIVGARQLFHNRSEVTVVLRKLN